MAKNITAETVQRKDFENAIKTINCYYRKITGKKDCLIFYVDYVQPIKILIDDIDGHEDDIDKLFKENKK